MINQFTKSAASLVSPFKRLREQRDAALRRVDELERSLASGAAMAPDAREHVVAEAVARALCKVRDEYTSLPRFGYHLPLDYDEQTLPPRFNSPVFVDGEALPLPPNAERHGHAISDAEYLEWGRYEKEIILEFMRDALPSLDNLAIMDFGCSSGRILRHFYDYSGQRNWKLVGVDVSARRIEWMRRNFPKEIEVYTGTFLPILPFRSNSFDAIYGMSVFTHIKYLWDTWLLELRRVLKPGGVLIQSIHTEHAWSFFAEHREEDWARDALGPMLVEHLEMPADFVYFGRSGQEPGFLERRNRCRFLGKIF